MKTVADSLRLISIHHHSLDISLQFVDRKKLY